MSILFNDKIYSDNKVKIMLMKNEDVLLLKIMLVTF